MDSSETFTTEKTIIPQVSPDALEGDSKRSSRMSRFSLQISRRKIFAFVLVAILVLIFFGFLTFQVYKEGKEFYASVLTMKDKVSLSNIEEIKKGAESLKKERDELEKAYSRIGILRFIPFVRQYYQDGMHAIRGIDHGLQAGTLGVDAFTPYSDILGFSTDSQAESETAEKNAQERLDFIVQSLPEVIPKVGEISKKVSDARIEIEKINPDRYPEKMFGKKVREEMKKGVALLIEIDEYIKKSKPLLEVAPYLLGQSEKRKYLVLFQNDKELRPTGGFLTAYSVAEVEKGKFNPVNSSDIYSLDAKYKPQIEASKPVIDYIKGIYVLNKNYRLRDMNWSPDFEESIELFLTEAKKAGLEDVDGVIAVDTHLLVNILDVLGPIGVPGFGNFSNNIEPKCDCPQVIYELESFADVEGPIVWDPLDPTRIIYAPKNFDNRKKIIGPLMNSVLSNALSSPKEKMPALFNAVFKSVTEKHVLLYIHDDKSQKAAEGFGIAGKIEDHEGDYLHINDANLGGRKSNLYVTQEVVQEVKIGKTGDIEKKLTIKYKNSQDYDGWLNSVLPNWTRVYLPKGSEILETSGFDDKGPIYEEFDKTVVSGGFQLRPKGIAAISITYKLPFRTGKDYSIKIQKQPGIASPLYSFEINGTPDEFYLDKDIVKSYKVK